MYKNWYRYSVLLCDSACTSACIHNSTFRTLCVGFIRLRLRFVSGAIGFDFRFATSNTFPNGTVPQLDDLHAACTCTVCSKVNATRQALHKDCHRGRPDACTLAKMQPHVARAGTEVGHADRRQLQPHALRVGVRLGAIQAAAQVEVVLVIQEVGRDVRWPLLDELHAARAKRAAVSSRCRTVRGARRTCGSGARRGAGEGAGCGCGHRLSGRM